MKTLFPLLCAVFVSVVFAVWIYLEKQRVHGILTKKSAKLCFFCMLFSAAAFVCVSAACGSGQSFRNTVSREGDAPVVLILSSAVALASAAAFVRIVLSGKTDEMLRAEDGYTESLRIQRVTGGIPDFKGKDIVIAFILFLLSAAMIFPDIGSRDTPQSGTKLSAADGNKEIVLTFAGRPYLSKVRIFFGNMAPTNLACFTASGEGWELVNSGTTFIHNSVYKWKGLDIGRKADSVDIILTTGETVINEMVFLDSNGKTVLPYNHGDYPELFDEQDRYPEYESYEYQTMFDEVYHARTAYEFIHGIKTYENTHPPLGKIIIGLGIRLFGMNPFGWRFFCALFGSMYAPLIYLFVFRVTGKRKLSLSGSVLVMTEFMHYALSRISTLDIIVAFFILLMFYQMFCFGGELRAEKPLRVLCFRLFRCGVATALAVATKWTGCYAAAGICIQFFVLIISQWRRNGTTGDSNALNASPAEGGNTPRPFSAVWLAAVFGTCILSFLVIPGVVYVLSYIPFRPLSGGSLIKTAIDNGRQMLSYHSSATKEHPYSSPWYSWLIDYRPLLDSLTVMDDRRSSVATFGNPVVLLCGLAALVHNIRMHAVHREASSGMLVSSYLAMLVPWMFISRTVFIYQYFPCTVLLVPLICNSIDHVRKKKTAAVCVTAASVILFLIYFPVLSGRPASYAYFKRVLEILPSWTFA